MKKLKRKFVDWLLKDTEISFNVFNNSVTGTIKNCAINLEIIGNVVLDKTEIPEGLEIVIRKIKPNT